MGQGLVLELMSTELLFEVVYFMNLCINSQLSIESLFLEFKEFTILIGYFLKVFETISELVYLLLFSDKTLTNI